MAGRLLRALALVAVVLSKPGFLRFLTPEIHDDPGRRKQEHCDQAVGQPGFQLGDYYRKHVFNSYAAPSESQLADMGCPLPGFGLHKLFC
jgi:hypothetical protein